MYFPGTAETTEFTKYFSYDLQGWNDAQSIDCEDNTVRSYIRNYIESNEDFPRTATSYTFVDCKNVAVEGKL